MAKLLLILTINTILLQSCSSIIKDNISIEISTYKKNGITKATAMPEFRKDSELQIYKKRFEYLLINVSEIHKQDRHQKRVAIWNLYPDTLTLKNKYLEEFVKDKKLEQYFTETYNSIQKQNTDSKITYTLTEVMTVASKFFYCDKILPDTTVQAHICIGLNGIKEANWEKDLTLVEAFCYEAIFNELDSEVSELRRSFLNIKQESTQKFNNNFTSLESLLGQVKLDVFNSMMYNEQLTKCIHNYYEQNRDNLAFEINIP